MQNLIDRRWKELCEAVVTYGDHPESWNRAAALAEIQHISSFILFLAAWAATQATRKSKELS